MELKIRKLQLIRKTTKKFKKQKNNNTNVKTTVTYKRLKTGKNKRTVQTTTA